MRTVKKWLSDIEFMDTLVEYGPNGIVGGGKKDMIVIRER
jgi:hypothetical protein